MKKKITIIIFLILLTVSLFAFYELRYKPINEHWKKCESNKVQGIIGCE
ncbi:hypothetical protein [Bacillus sp. ISL-39]|nr:hypothetical protein [Bacillus sp. ISL-39]MBT2636438.1 hypothetical protein [Bacillus sp. ISL-39]